MKLQKQAFTLVELIVVITILAILWTIAFLSYQWYSKSARDGVRISDIQLIQKSLDLFKLKTWYYPSPTDWFQVTYSWSNLWNQWTFWEVTFKNLEKLNKLPIDPLTWSEYTYSLLNTKKEYELWSIIEWGALSSNNILSKTYATDNLIALVKWNYNWIVAKISTWWLDYVLSLPSIITSDLSDLDILNILRDSKLVFNGKTNIPGSYKNKNFTSTWWFIYNSLTPDKIIVFSWTLSDLYSTGEILKNFTEKLQKSYSWSSLSLEWIYSDILNLDLLNNPSIVSLVWNIVNENLWWNINTNVVFLPQDPIYIFNSTEWLNSWVYSWTILFNDSIELNNIVPDYLWIPVSWWNLLKISPDTWNTLETINLWWTLDSVLVTKKYVFVNDILLKKIHKIDKITNQKVWEIISSKYILTFAEWKDWYIYAITWPNNPLIWDFNAGNNSMYIEKINIETNNIISSNYLWQNTSWYNTNLLINKNNIAYIPFWYSWVASTWIVTYNLNTSTNISTYSHSPYSYWYCWKWAAVDSSWNFWTSCSRAPIENTLVKITQSWWSTRFCSNNSCWSLSPDSDLIIDSNNYLRWLFNWNLFKYNIWNNTSNNIALSWTANGISFLNWNLWIISWNNLLKIDSSNGSIIQTIALSWWLNPDIDFTWFETANIFNINSWNFESDIIDLWKIKKLSHISYDDNFSNWTNIIVDIWWWNTPVEDWSWVWVSDVVNNWSINSIGNSRYIKLRLTLNTWDKFLTPKINNIKIY